MKFVSLALGAALVATPLRAEVSIRDLVQIVDISSLTVSPDGRRVAYRQQAASVERNVKELSWWVAELDGPPQPRRLADGGQVIWTYAGTLSNEPPQWSPDGRTLYFRALAMGEVQIWKASVDSGRAEQVTHDAADILGFTVSGDGSGLTYQVGATRAAIVAAEKAERDAGVRIDATIDPAQSLFDAVEINGRLAAQRLTGKWFQRAGLLAASRVETKLITFGAGTISRSATSPPGVVEVDRGALYVRRPGGSRQPPPTSWPTGRISWSAWRPGHDQLVAAVADPARRQALYIWDPGRKRVRRLINGPGLLTGGESATPCALTKSMAVCVDQSPMQPPRLVAIDLVTGALRPLAEPNAEKRLTPPSPPRALTWTTADGTTASGWLMAPAPALGAGRSPLFVTYYVCEGYMRGGVGDEYPMALLAQSGIAVLCINKVSPPGEAYDAERDYQLAASTIRAAIDLLDRQGLIDPGKVGMGGFSFGSEVTMWTAIHTDMLAAAAIASTQIEPAYYWLNGAPGRDNHAVLAKSWGLGAPETTPDRWKLFSPALNTEKIRAPLLMQLPEQEYRLSFELFARLAQTKTPVDLYAFANEPHNKTQPAHKLAVYQRNLDWFRFWLLNADDPTPSRAEQYARWREMAKRQAQDRSPGAAVQP